MQVDSTRIHRECFSFRQHVDIGRSLRFFKPQEAIFRQQTVQVYTHTLPRKPVIGDGSERDVVVESFQDAADLMIHFVIVI